MERPHPNPGTALALLLVATIGAVLPNALRAAPGDGFDGAWAAYVTCAASRGGVPYAITVLGRVNSGAMRLSRGTQGTPDSHHLEGQIAADGTATLRMFGLTADPTYSMGNVASGTPYNYAIKARFEGGRGKGERIDGRRACDIDFVRQ